MTLTEIINTLLSDIINPLIPVLVGLAIVFFAWGLIKYLKAGLGESAELEKAKNLMVWGILVIFVMVSVWGLVSILQGIFGTGSYSTPPTIPKF